jgi:hypothetical protein
MGFKCNEKKLLLEKLSILLLNQQVFTIRFISFLRAKKLLAHKSSSKWVKVTKTVKHHFHQGLGGFGYFRPQNPICANLSVKAYKITRVFLKHIIYTIFKVVFKRL